MMKKPLDFIDCYRYEIYDNGDIINSGTGRKIVGSYDRDGYNIVSLYTEESNYKKVKSFRRHVLVAQAFLPNPENRRTVNHKDANKTHNWVSNLEWNTDKENIGHGHRNNLYKQRIEKARYEAIVRAICDGMKWCDIHDTFNIGTATIANIKKKGLVSWDEYYG